uniref:Serpentine Receptor, class T n=1 Tax=Rhabditophanes sp. KR3021 TaxID=114890 RepID=A0AC35TL88_9BILA
MSIGDITNLGIAGIASGYFMINNDVYCSHPTLIFILGAFAFSLWVYNDVLTLVLAISRSFYMLSPATAEQYFYGYRTYLWLIPPIMIWLWTFLFTPPVLFSSVLTSWVFQPYAGFPEAEKHDIRNIYHTINNYFVCASQIILYTLVTIIHLYLNQNRITQANRKKAKLTGIGLFFQSASMCAITVTTAVLYVIGESVSVPPWFITTAHTFWILTHGFPGVIFLIANKTLKTKIKNWIPYKSTHGNVTKVQPRKSTTKY